MALHNTGSHNVQYTEKCSKCGRKITPQGLRRHEAVCDDQREIARLTQEMQEAEERRLLEMFKCPRLCEFQHQTHIQIVAQFSLFIVNNNPIPSSISPHIHCRHENILVQDSQLHRNLSDNGI